MFHFNVDIIKRRISVCNVSGINYVMLAEEAKYFSLTSECYAYTNFLTFIKIVKL